MLVGFNLTFFPMHLLGIYGMPRRTYRYDAGLGWDTLNFLATIGGFIIAVSVLLFIVNAIVSHRRGKLAGNDPWDARTIEWTTTSPPPEYNFAEIPQIEARDDFWRHKYVEDDEGMLVALPSGGADTPAATRAAAVSPHPIHMPSPSFFPFVAALGIVPLGYAAVFHHYTWAFALLAAGALVVAFGVYAWGIEPPTAEEPH
jgi:cytochrome c oxidase subunit I